MLCPVFAYSIATYHCASVIIEYHHYPITTAISFAKETNFSTSPDNIPDMTVCNLNPISSVYAAKGEYVTQILKVSEYFDMVQKCNDCPLSVLGISLPDLFFTSSAYYQNIGRDNASLIGHDVGDFIVSCYVELFDGFAVEFIPCSRMLDINMVTYPSLFNCYRLSLRDIKYSGFITGYKLVMHLDNYDADHTKYLTSKYQFSQSLGAVMLLHTRGTRGHMQRNAIFLSPGTGVDLKIMIQIIRRLEPPYGSCVESGALHYNKQLGYTYFSCVSGCVQEKVLKVGNYPKKEKIRCIIYGINKRLIDFEFLVKWGDPSTYVPICNRFAFFGTQGMIACHCTPDPPKVERDSPWRPSVCPSVDRVSGTDWKKLLAPFVWYLGTACGESLGPY